MTDRDCRRHPSNPTGRDPAPRRLPPGGRADWSIGPADAKRRTGNRSSLLGQPLRRSRVTVAVIRRHSASDGAGLRTACPGGLVQLLHEVSRRSPSRPAVHPSVSVHGPTPEEHRRRQRCWRRHGWWWAMTTNVYVDGPNLYYGVLRDSSRSLARPADVGQPPVARPRDQTGPLCHRVGQPGPGSWSAAAPAGVPAGAGDGRRGVDPPRAVAQRRRRPPRRPSSRWSAHGVAARHQGCRCAAGDAHGRRRRRRRLRHGRSRDERL